MPGAARPPSLLGHRFASTHTGPAAFDAERLETRAQLTRALITGDSKAVATLVDGIQRSVLDGRLGVQEAEEMLLLRDAQGVPLLDSLTSGAHNPHGNIARAYAQSQALAAFAEAVGKSCLGTGVKRSILLLNGELASGSLLPRPPWYTAAIGVGIFKSMKQEYADRVLGIGFVKGVNAAFGAHAEACAKNGMAVSAHASYWHYSLGYADAIARRDKKADDHFGPKLRFIFAGVHEEVQSSSTPQDTPAVQ